MRNGAKIGMVSGVLAVVASGVGYGAYNIWTGLNSSGGGSGTSSTTQAAPVRTGPPTDDEISSTAKDFLTAWSDGDAEKASQLTNNAGDSQPLLAGYREDAHVTKVTLTPGAPTGAKVPFTVEATLSFEGKTKPWSYSSSLTVVRGLTTGRALVDWDASVIHPQLKKGDTLTTGEAKAAPVKAVDRNNIELTKEKYPSLGPILDAMRERYGSKAGGKPGIETYIEKSSDGTSADTAPAKTLVVLAKGTPGLLHTTLDARTQAAAETAVKKFDESSVVAVKASTGEIRAVANHRADSFNAAMQGKLAPGSTMKIMTAAMLINNGVASEKSPVLCPSEAIWHSQTFHNLDNFSIAGGTLETSFARSCNTAFIKPLSKLSDLHVADTALPSTAKKYFGIGEVWNVGIASADGSVPETTGPNTAAAMIGQGLVQMNPLNMAAVTATARSGSFHQPVIVPRSMLDGAVATAQPLPYNTAQQLRDMMHTTATAPYGTGTVAMSGVGGYKGAKTGSAEVDAQGKSNSWFTGFSNDLAAAAVVQSGGHGGDAAGPVVAAVLAAGS
ncbi:MULTISPECIES: penicillin-binding transpeptidase domain-containing protein [unclassified Streptomyces]|uniref:penicillin-binding transpeptidase domain-containing protein n=1 Tax=unclassified Streptomyces TaxID=2593676 RepID=UPI0020257774|nr:penicillin-binding transpeptidase domain-containing protein [Streptomyces sp. A 4/2]WSV55841.1 penicillin-binding transpeptidase domain-containing protein [Streptomyces sp. NBC_01014]